MPAKGKKSGYREKLRHYVEASVVPQGMRLLPRLELEGRREVFIERHRGILEYSCERVLVLSGEGMLEIEGEGMKIAAMSRDFLRIKGKITGVRVLEL